MSNQKPLLFGSNTLDAAQLAALDAADDAGWDNAYVPGYSETQRANELAVRDGRKPAETPHLYWARTQRTDGSNVDYRDAGLIQRAGYRACTLADLKENGWAMPPAAHVGADGLIRREDLTLAIVDSGRRKINQGRKAARNAEFEGRERTSSTGVVTTATEKTGRSLSLEEAKQQILGG